MKIYSVNQNPVQTNKNQINFTNKITVKLYRIVETPQGKMLMKASKNEYILSSIKKVINIIKGKNLANSKLNQDIINLFNEKIFKPHELHNLKGSSYNGEGCLYTGSEAEQLEILGKKFEKANKRVDALGQKIPLDEVERKVAKVKAEYASLMKIINSPEHLLQTSLKEGQPPEDVEIHIKAICPLRHTKKGHKYQIIPNQVTLERYGTEPENQIPNPSLYPQTQKPAKIVEKRFSNRYKPSAKKLPHNIQGNLFA